MAVSAYFAGAIQLNVLLRQRVGNVVPGQRMGARADGFLKGGHALIGLIGRDVRLAQRSISSNGFLGWMSTAFSSSGTASANFF